MTVVTSQELIDDCHGLFFTQIKIKIPFILRRTAASKVGSSSYPPKTCRAHPCTKIQDVRRPDISGNISRLCYKYNTRPTFQPEQLNADGTTARAASVSWENRLMPWLSIGLRTAAAPGGSGLLRQCFC